MPRPRKNPFQLLTTTQVAQLTGHSEETIRRWVKKGKLRAVCLSRSPRFLEQEIERMIRNARQEAEA